LASNHNDDSENITSETYFLLKAEMYTKLANLYGVFHLDFRVVLRKQNQLRELKAPTFFFKSLAIKNPDFKNISMGEQFPHN